MYLLYFATELGPHARSRTTSRSSPLLPVSRAVPLPPADLSPRLGFIARARVCDSSHPPPCRPWCVVRVVCVAVAPASRVSSPAAIVHSAARRSLACARCSPLVLLFTRRCTRTMMIRRPRWCVVPRNRASCLAPLRRTDAHMRRAHVLLLPPTDPCRRQGSRRRPHGHLWC